MIEPLLMEASHGNDGMVMAGERRQARNITLNTSPVSALPLLAKPRRTRA
jgi:hypothetical protein